jgi:CHAT domain-containing protein/Tfp pilus assembly protein PilF
MRRRFLTLLCSTLIIFILSSALPLSLPSLWAQTLPQERLQERYAEAQRLFQQGIQESQLGQLEAAIASYQQALTLYQDPEIRQAHPTESQEVTGAAQVNMGMAYNALGQYTEAIDVLQQALVIQESLQNDKGKIYTFSNLGQAHIRLGKYAEAIAFFQQALSLQQTLADLPGAGFSWMSLGRAYTSLGQYAQAKAAYQQALAIQRQLKNPAGEAELLGSLGNIELTVGQYSQAIAYYQQALQIQQGIGNPLENTARNRQGEADSLNNLGLAYRLLGKYDQAIDFHQQALVIYRERQGSSLEQNVQRLREAGSLIGLANAYVSLTQYAKAIDFYQQALQIVNDAGMISTFPDESRRRQGFLLQGIGTAYALLEQYPQAIASFQEALTLAQATGNRLNEAHTLANLGSVSLSLKNYVQALEFYQQALVVHRELGDREGESSSLGNLGLVLESIEQPELAIVFLKQSVNVRESIRLDLQALSPDLQQSYAETHSTTYRRLADLLLQGDRVLEAQQVLDLLKVQELQEYLQNVRGNEQSAQGVKLQATEQEIVTLYEQSKPQSFNEFSHRPEVLTAIEQMKADEKAQVVNLEQLIRLQNHLKTVKNAVILYPLILKDRLELVLIKPDAPPIRRTVTVDEITVKQAILEFRSQITNPLNRKFPAAQQLYTWLIQPLESELTQADTILYAADGQLRYVPLEAFYDGKQWLVQRFNINYITAASLTNFSAQPLGGNSLRVLAGGFSEGQAQFQVGDRQFKFSGLPNAATEITNIASHIADTTQFMNQQFNRTTILSQMDRYRIIHFATHAEFVVGTPEDSFILLGNGDRISLREIEQWRLPHVELVVLSACQTAVGGKLGNGAEILGLGYQIQRTGARAAIASLWSVDDGGTQVLMNAFYASLIQPGMTKAKALRQAQITLITGDYGGAEVDPDQAAYLQRPYYWAPFILIGNGV